MSWTYFDLNIKNSTPSTYTLAAFESKVYAGVNSNNLGLVLQSFNRGSAFKSIADYEQVGPLAFSSAGNLYYFGKYSKQNYPSIFINDFKRIVQYKLQGKVEDVTYDVLSVSGSGGDIYFGSSTSGIFYHLNNIGVSKLELPTNFVSFMDCDSSGDKLVATSVDGDTVGFYTSDDKGNTWTQIVEDILDVQNPEASRAYYSPDGNYRLLSYITSDVLNLVRNTTTSSVSYFVNAPDHKFTLSKINYRNQYVFGVSNRAYLGSLTSLEPVRLVGAPVNASSEFINCTINQNSSLISLLDSSGGLSTYLIGADPNKSTNTIIGLSLAVFVILVILGVFITFIVIWGIYKLIKYAITSFSPYPEKID